MKILGDNSPPGFVIKGGEGTISRSALIELLQAVLDRNMSFKFQAPGFSMIPFILNGDVITVSRIPENYPYFGKVVAFIHPKFEQIVVHRIIGKNGNSFLLKGDNRLNSDGFVQKEKILGYIKKVERNGKEVSIGQGPERFIIVLLSRIGFLNPLINLYNIITRPLIKVVQKA